MYKYTSYMLCVCAGLIFFFKTCYCYFFFFFFTGSTRPSPAVRQALAALTPLMPIPKFFFSSCV